MVTIRQPAAPCQPYLLAAVTLDCLATSPAGGIAPLPGWYLEGATVTQAPLPHLLIRDLAGLGMPSMLWMLAMLARLFSLGVRLQGTGRLEKERTVRLSQCQTGNMRYCHTLMMSDCQTATI